METELLVFGRRRRVGNSVVGSGGVVRENRYRSVLRLLGFRAAGCLVLLFLLPGEFPLSLLEGEFRSCHGLPPLAFLPLRGSTCGRKKGRPGAILARRNAPWVMPLQLNGLYVFGRRPFLALRYVETYTLPLG